MVWFVVSWRLQETVFGETSCCSLLDVFTNYDELRTFLFILSSTIKTLLSNIRGKLWTHHGESQVRMQDLVYLMYSTSDYMVY